MAGNLLEHADGLLLYAAGGFEFPLVVHLVFLALLLTLVLGLSLGNWYIKRLRKRRKAQGAKDKRNEWYIRKHTRRIRFGGSRGFTNYGTYSISSSFTSPSKWFGFSVFGSSERSSLRSPGHGSVLSLSGWLRRMRFVTSLRFSYNRRQLNRALWNAVIRFEAWSVYQPAPLPLLKTQLPCNGTTLAIVGMYGFVLLSLVVGIPFTIDYPLMLAGRAGPLAVTLLPCLYLFSAKNQPLQFLTSYSYEDLNIFHRRLGELVIGLAVYHSIGKAALWYLKLTWDEVRFLVSETRLLIVSGLVTFILYEFLFVTSFKPFRRRFYHLFVQLHSYGQFFALVALAVHSSMSRPYVIVAFGIFFIDRIIYRTLLRTRNTIAQVKVFPDQETIRLVIDKESNGFQTCKILKKLGLKQAFQGDWQPTHHVFVRIPSVKGHENELHPYFVACAAPCEHPWSSVIDLNLIIPARGAWSRELKNIACRNHLHVDIDGPYGSLYPVEMMQDRDICILIAGGPGIAGVWPLAWSLVDDDPLVDLESINCETQSRQEVLLIWHYKTLHNDLWVGGRDELELLERQGITVITVGPTAQYPRANLEADIEWWMYRHDPHDRLRTGIACCGPPEMQRLVRNKAAEEIRNGRKMAYCEMSFGL